MINICIIGSSTGWTPTLATDLMSVFKEPLEFRLLDIDPRPAGLCAEWGRAAARQMGRRDRFIPFSDRRAALDGADAVIITISTGGLSAMEADIAIPEKYGIFATVGDTAGPGGWSRAVRNVPVFRQFAEDFDAICPKAFIANYTNPMAALTGALQLSCGNPVVGLCHAYFETKDVIQRIFALKDWGTISISIAGMNHFTWVTDFRVGREDGYALLRKKIGRGSLHDVLPAESSDEIGIISGHELCVELYDAFGYLPYPADRHTSEFVSFALCGNPERYLLDSRKASGEKYDTIRYCNLKRTPISQRRQWMLDRDRHIDRLMRDARRRSAPPKRSRETGAEMIHAYVSNHPFTDAVNTLNVGQIPGLPLGACVETLGLVDGLGVRPVIVPGVPEHLLELMRRNAVVQKWTTEGALKGDRNLLLQALYQDPQCAQLKPHEVRSMAGELFAANKSFATGKARRS